MYFDYFLEAIKLQEKLDYAYNIVKDILDGCESKEMKFIDSDTHMKCSKSAIKNALYFVDKGEDVSLCFGYVDNQNAKYVANNSIERITHVWINHNGKLLETFPNSLKIPIKHILLKEIKLIPNDVELSILKIKKELCD